MKKITYTIALLLALTPLSALADTFNDVIVGGSAHLDESLIHILETKTDTENARRILQGNVLTLTPGSESQTDFRNLYIHTDVDNANVRKVSGFTSDVYHNSGGTLTDGFGTVNQIWSWDSGDITTARGALNAAHNKGTGNFFSAYGASNYVGNYNPTGVGITAGYGAYNHIGNESTGEITTAYGALNEVLNSSTGKIGTAYGASYYIGNASSTGEITTAKSLSVGLHNSGVIQDWYGLHITPVSGTAPTGNRYGVYVEDAADNYFAGNVGIGTTTISERLSVDGTIHTTGGVKFADGTVQTTAGGGGGSSVWNTSGSDIYYSGGSVGVGGASPSNALHITNSNPTIRLEDSDNSSVVYSQIQSNGQGDLVFYADPGAASGNTEIIFDVDGSEAVRIESNGNVGVGTADLDAALHVVVEGVETAFKAERTTAPTFIQSKFGGGDSAWYHEVNAGGTSYIQGIDDGDFDKWKISYGSTGDATFGTNDYFILDQSGNVGIGDSSPNNPLEINATNKLGSSFLGGIAGEGVRVTQTDYVSGNYVSLLEGSYDDGSVTPDVRIGAMFDGGGSNLYFGTSNSYATGITNTAFAIDSSGNVGIGKADPLGELHVSSPGKTVIIWDSESVTEGACVKIKDSDGGGYTYMTVLDGAASFSTTSCE